MKAYSKYESSEYWNYKLCDQFKQYLASQLVIGNRNTKFPDVNRKSSYQQHGEGRKLSNGDELPLTGKRTRLN